MSTQTTASASPTHTQHLFLGHRSMTPTISGIVSGGTVALAWIIGFIIYFYKRHRREKRARALGFRSHREMLDPPKKMEAFIIPPDPAIVEAGFRPGQRVYNDPKIRGDDSLQHAHTIPMSVLKTSHNDVAEKETPRPDTKHSTSEPAWYGDQTPASPGTSAVPRWPSSPRSISSEVNTPKGK